MQAADMITCTHKHIRGKRERLAFLTGCIFLVARFGDPVKKRLIDITPSLQLCWNSRQFQNCFQRLATNWPNLTLGFPDIDVEHPWLVENDPPIVVKNPPIYVSFPGVCISWAASDPIVKSNWIQFVEDQQQGFHHIYFPIRPTIWHGFPVETP